MGMYLSSLDMATFRWLVLPPLYPHYSDCGKFIPTTGGCGPLLWQLYIKTCLGSKLHIKMASSSDFVSQFNAAAYSKTKRLQDLIHGKPYDILQMRQVSTRYGPAIVTQLQADGEEFDVFLPSRYVEVFGEKKSIDFSKHCLVYNGTLQIVKK